MYGVAVAALGMLSTLSTCLAIDVYGPISDNAGGIAEVQSQPLENYNPNHAPYTLHPSPCILHLAL